MKVNLKPRPLTITNTNLWYNTPVSESSPLFINFATSYLRVQVSIVKEGGEGEAVTLCIFEGSHAALTRSTRSFCFNEQFICSLPLVTRTSWARNNSRQHWRRAPNRGSLNVADIGLFFDRATRASVRKQVAFASLCREKLILSTGIRFPLSRPSERD